MCEVAEEDLIAGLGIPGVPLALVFIVPGRITAARAVGLLRLAQQLQGRLHPVSLDEGPVHGHIAVGVALLGAVIEIAQGIQVPGVFGKIIEACIGGLIVQLGIGLLLQVANLLPQHIDDFTCQPLHQPTSLTAAAASASSRLTRIP